MRILDRKLTRNLMRAKGQSVAVAAVIMVGVTTLVTILSAYRGLKLTRDTYYRQYRFADFWVPLERAPARAVRKVEAVPGVLRAEGRIVEEVNLDVPGVELPRKGRLISVPEKGARINGVHLVSGQWFSAATTNEVVLSDSFAQANGLGPGDLIHATMNDRKQPLRIVGTGLSPEFVYAIPNTREFVPDASRFGVLWVREDFAEMALGMQEARNEIVGFLDPSADPDAVLDRVEDVLQQYGALTAIERKDQVSNRYLSDEIKGLSVSARITPTIFLGIAAMILTIMIERIVRRERAEIGVLKAFGYSNAAIAAHYVKFALALSLAGALLGTVAGYFLALNLMKVYVQFFHFPILRHRFYPDIFALSLLVSAMAGGLGAAWAVKRAVGIDPAQAMRPEAPRAGHRLFLERIGFVWRRVSFIGKMIFRDIFRYKLRAALTVFGVMMSAAILMLGFFGGDSMDYLLRYQFDVLQREDLRVGLWTERGKAAWYEAMRYPGVRRTEPQLNYPFKLKNGWREKDVLVTGIVPNASMTRLETIDGRPFALPEEGLVITHPIARDLGVGPGSTVIMKPLLGRVEREVEVPVRAVVRQYLGIGAYMDLRALSRTLREPFAMNTLLMQVDPADQPKLVRFLKDVPAAASVEVKREVQRKAEETMAESMAISNLFIGVFAGVIAFAIIYNSTVISLTERQRELASLRVLGFTLAEVRRIVHGENALLATVGTLLGIPLGLALCKALISAYDTDLYRMPFHVSDATYVKSLLALAAFAFAANLATRRRIARMDLVEVLKERE